jgi:hypothetical protein
LLGKRKAGSDYTPKYAVGITFLRVVRSAAFLSPSAATSTFASAPERAILRQKATEKSLSSFTATQQNSAIDTIKALC